MDTEVKAILDAAAVDTSGIVPSVSVLQAADHRVVPIEDTVFVANGDRPVEVRLKSISQLWTGNTKPPDFSRGPPPAYEKFFYTIEKTAARYCAIAEPPNDDEFRRLYTLLRRRPDGVDANPLFSYLQASVRLYASLRDVSQAEHEAVARRLEQSAKRFDAGGGSKNYFHRVLESFLT